MNACNIGYSDAMERAICDALRRHGEVVSVTKDPFTALRLGQWTLYTYDALSGMGWLNNYHLTRAGEEPTCGQCARCSDFTPETIARTTVNLPYLEPEEAHILEDNVLRWALAEIAAGATNAVELAQAAHIMASQQRTRWYA